MAKTLAIIILLAAFGFAAYHAQEYDVSYWKNCIRRNGKIEFNSIAFGNTVYTRQNIRKICYELLYNSIVLENTDMSIYECASAAYTEGKNSFSLNSGVCELSSFYATPNTSALILPAPSDTVATEVIFVAHPIVDESLAELNFASEVPYFKDIQWSWNGERSLNITTQIQLGGRLCMIEQLYWEDLSGNNDVIPVGESVNFTISSDLDICHSRQVFIYLSINNVDGSQKTISHSLMPQLTGEDLEFKFVWKEACLYPNNVSVQVTINGALDRLTKVDYLQNDISMYFNEAPQDSDELSFTMTFPVSDDDCSIGFDGYLTDIFGCPSIKQRVTRNVCTVDRIINETRVYDIATKDFCSYCCQHEGNMTFSEANAICNSYVPQFLGSFHLPQAFNQKVADIVKTSTEYQCTLKWIGYEKINGIWQWPDRTTELNSTLFNTTVFDSQSDELGHCSVIRMPIQGGFQFGELSPPGPPCTAEDEFPNLMIEKHDCDSNEPCALCLAFYSGDITDKIPAFIDWNNYKEDLITALYPS